MLVRTYNAYESACMCCAPSTHKRVHVSFTPLRAASPHGLTRVVDGRRRIGGRANDGRQRRRRCRRWLNDVQPCAWLALRSCWCVLCMYVFVCACVCVWILIKAHGARHQRTLEPDDDYKCAQPIHVSQRTVLNIEPYVACLCECVCYTIARVRVQSLVIIG